jgi:hypothetical protein
MKDTYRLSEGLALRQFSISLGLTLLVLAGLTFKWLREGEGAATVYLMIAIAAFAVFFFRRNYKQAQGVAKTHSLTLSSDALLIRDGATEQRIPYDAIELLRIRRPIFGAANFTLKVSGLPGGPFYGYDDIEGLIAALSTRLPGDRVTGKRVHV